MLCILVVVGDARRCVDRKCVRGAVELKFMVLLSYQLQSVSSYLGNQRDGLAIEIIYSNEN